jgi:peptidoglycan/xylan/chitin deacetylase (PgdA/CDA1 family)
MNDSVAATLPEPLNVPKSGVIPPQSEACRKSNRGRFLLSLVPGTICLILLSLGLVTAAFTVFALFFLIICWGIFVPRSQWFAPHLHALNAQQAQAGHVWITIDDGPDPVTTPKLLDLLDRYQAQAGFFLIGDKAACHPEWVREIAARGHVIGNHTQTHCAAWFWALHPDRMWREVAGCQETLTRILGHAPVWFRPPVGHHNPFLVPPLRALNLTMVMWSARGFDGVACDPRRVLDRLEQGLQPGGILLLHDGTPTCVEVLEGTLKLLAARGLISRHPQSETRSV